MTSGEQLRDPSRGLPALHTEPVHGGWVSLSLSHTHTHTPLLLGLAMAASVLCLSADVKYYLVPPVTHLLPGRWSVHLYNNTWRLHT